MKLGVVITTFNKFCTGIGIFLPTICVDPPISKTNYEKFILFSKNSKRENVLTINE